MNYKQQKAIQGFIYAHINLRYFSSQASAGILYQVWRCVKMKFRARQLLLIHTVLYLEPSDLML